jgi:hypothetical protein
MARKLSWQDLTVLHRYQGHRLVLDTSLQLVYNPGLFSCCLLSLVFPRSEFYTAVDPLRDDQFPALFGQITLARKGPSARLAFLAPGNPAGNYNFGPLLSHLAGEAAERGAIQILAEASLDSPGEELLSRCGFRPYAEQQIWKLPRRLAYGSGKRSWIPASRRDNQRAASLYQRSLPSKIQHVEPPPTFPEAQAMVSWADGRLVGLALTQFGPRGILIDLLLDRSQHTIDEYLSALMFHLPYRSTRDVYLRVRSYQQELASALERIGASPGERQRALVKKLAVHYNAKQTFAVQGFEKQPDITTPISNTKIKN